MLSQHEKNEKKNSVKLPVFTSKAKMKSRADIYK